MLQARTSEARVAQLEQRLAESARLERRSTPALTLTLTLPLTLTLTLTLSLTLTLTL